MVKVELSLPQVQLQISGGNYHEVTKMIVAGGRAPQSRWLKEAACGLQVSCADRGAVYCQQAGIAPWLLCGDGDSAGQEIYAALAEQKTEIARFNPMKDDTDLQLLLTRQCGANLIVSGVFGGRFDHLYSNIYSLLAYRKHSAGVVVLADDKEVMLLLTRLEKAVIILPEPDKIKAVSLLPLTPSAKVSISGVQWSLQDAELKMLHPYAISNKAIDNILCSCHQGDLGLYFCFAE